MTDTTETKSYLIYIPPSPAISDLLEKANSSLREKHPSNTYVPLYKGEWHSHLMVYLSPMPFSFHNKILAAVEKIVAETNAFTVELAENEMADANYLQVRISEKSQVPIRAIRQKLIDALLPYRDQTIKDKYLQKWDTYTEEEQHRIKTTGIPYKYEPHFTLGVFGDKEELAQAYQESLSFDFRGLSFVGDKIEILTSIGSDYADKEIVFSKSLRF